MTAVKEFIKSACKKIHSAFPQTILEYEYKDFSDTHFIKITPSEVYHKDEFIDLSFELSDDFDDSFTGVLCFIYNEELTELRQPEVICRPQEEAKEYSAYGDFFDVSGSIPMENAHLNASIFSSSFNVKTTHKSVNITVNEDSLEEGYDTEHTSYAMAA